MSPIPKLMLKRKHGDHAYKPNSKETEKADPWDSLAWQPSLLGKLQASKWPCLKRNRMANTWGCPLISTGTDTHDYVHM